MKKERIYIRYGKIVKKERIDEIEGEGEIRKSRKN